LQTVATFEHYRALVGKLAYFVENPLLAAIVRVTEVERAGAGEAHAGLITLRAEVVVSQVRTNDAKLIPGERIEVSTYAGVAGLWSLRSLDGAKISELLVSVEQYHRALCTWAFLTEDEVSRERQARRSPADDELMREERAGLVRVPVSQLRLMTGALVWLKQAEREGLARVDERGATVVASSWAMGHPAFECGEKLTWLQLQEAWRAMRLQAASRPGWGELAEILCACELFQLAFQRWQFLPRSER